MTAVTPPATAGTVRLTVAVPTYRRPDDVAALLPVLRQQLTGLDGVAADVLVIDNDGEGPTAVTLRDCAGVRAVIEREPGIAAARNRALVETADVDLLVFVDDDERPSPGWLHALVDTWRRTGADAVAGPVVSSLGADPDPWLVAGGTFARAHRQGIATGSPIAVAATNNLLLHRPTVTRLGLRFDPDFGLSGGEDSLFTRQLTGRGGRLVWCAEAVVCERVPTGRATRRYAITRSVSHGNSEVRVALRLAGPARRPLVRLRFALGGAARLAAGGGRVVLGAVRGSLVDRARGARVAARGVGMLGGALGWCYREYRRRPQ